MKLAAVFGTLIALVTTLAPQRTAAQVPVDMFGIGINAGSESGALEVLYAFSPKIQAGAGLGLEVKSESHGSESTSTTNIVFAPFVRYIFAVTPTFRPFVNGQFIVSRTSGSNSYPADSTFQCNISAFI